MNLKRSIQMPDGDYTATIADLMVIVANAAGNPGPDTTNLSNGTFGFDMNNALKAVPVTNPPSPATFFIRNGSPSGRIFSINSKNGQELRWGTLFPEPRYRDGVVLGEGAQTLSVAQRLKSSFYGEGYDCYVISLDVNGVDYIVRIYHDGSPPPGLVLTLDPTTGSFYYEVDDKSVDPKFQNFKLTYIGPATVT